MPAMTAVPATRFSKTLSSHSATTSAPCLLVRIYPVDGVERPVDITNKSLTIGRDENCPLQITDDSVSRRHATLEPDGDAHVIHDCGSTNGTFVNEQRLSGLRRLLPGDRIRCGNHIYKYLSSDRIESQYHEVVFQMMTTDGLTAVHNKRYFLEALEREIDQSHRSRLPLCVMMMDLDKFKSVNDTYGHLAGDAVLVEFARRAKSVLPSGALLARYGGEEFAMLLTRTSLEEATVVAERLRQIVAATPMRYETTEIPVTVSLGLCAFDGNELPQPEHLIAEADRQLYQAKQNGRNQIVTSTWRPQP